MAEIMQGWLEAISESAWGPLLLLGIFLLRPVLLLPITILNVFAGFLFGPVLGFLYAQTATLLSSSIAFILGRFFGQQTASQLNMQAFGRRLQENSFVTVLSARLMGVPGDLVNYSAGFLRISFSQFLSATALGGSPGLLMAIFAGASLEGDFSFSGVRLNIWYLIISLILLTVSILSAVYLKRHEKRKDNP